MSEQNPPQPQPPSPEISINDVALVATEAKKTADAAFTSALYAHARIEEREASRGFGGLLRAILRNIVGRLSSVDWNIVALVLLCSIAGVGAYGVWYMAHQIFVLHSFWLGAGGVAIGVKVILFFLFMHKKLGL